ncbi:MAG TPA: glutamate-5-semialdehyde dehydrogenase [Pirellulales bacterium]|jgi:glutamate-5-semialdehyde dehydrogenase|nr:glutamate-5-semialdehyde dehydrogenase [Pirellulales bacterium]
MAIVEKVDLKAYCLDVAQRAKAASTELARATGAQKIDWLRRSAKVMRQRATEILEANRLDVAAAPGFGLTEAEIDRLKLTPARIESIAAALEQIAMLPNPVGEVMESSVRPNGLKVLKVRVPLGVVFFIYESRPNVTADAAAICVFSGNAVILRGGKEATHSSYAIVKLLRQMLDEVGLPSDAVQMVNTPDREAVGHFLRLHEWIDVAIPRGGESLIRRVAEEATMPVIKHFTGNCHVYVDRSADLDMAQRITINSKCQRMGVCNAAESLLVHADVAAEFLPRIGAALVQKGIEIRGDAKVREFIPQAKTATEEDYAAEYLGPIISARVVSSLAEAIRHINHDGSHHTDAIITDDFSAATQFTEEVDSSAVMVNASTRFNDGGEFGLGAEIGISTDKFHARGPCGLKELTSYKYVVLGAGQVRE